MTDGKDQITVEDVPEEESEDLEVSMDSLDEREIAAGKESGVIKDEHEEQPEPKAKEDSGEPEQKKEEKPSSFEEVEQNEDKWIKERVNKDGVVKQDVKGYTPNETSLYWKWKADKSKRQRMQKEVEEAKAEADLEKVQVLALEKKVAAVRDALKKGEDLTAEQLLGIIDEKAEQDVKKPETKDETAAIKAKIEEKAQFAEKIGEAQYENFQEIANQARDVITQDTSGVYQTLIDKSFLDDSIDENMLVDRIVKIAKMHPDFGKKQKESEESTSEEVEKAKKNATKKQSSASLASSGGKRVIAEDELTVADAAKLTTAQWGKLSENTRKRILMGVDP